MKPYNIEIFDRNYNFRASALIDTVGFTHKYDWLVREKNSIIVPDYVTIRLNEETGSVGDNTVCTGDYIVIWADDNDAAPYNSAQVIIKMESVRNGIEITYTDPMILFDHMVFIKIDDVKDMPTTQYIGQLITQEFGINNTDNKQRISNLEVVYDYSEEKGFFEYTDTNDFYTVINLLDDLILPAFRNYLIKTDINVKISEKKVSVNIAHILTTPSTIEGDLPNIASSNYILKQNSNEINKVTLVDIADENRQYNFYLHSDYTYTSTDTDRLTPVRNDVRVVDSDNITEEEFWYNENRALTVIDKYAQVDGNLTNAQLSELQNAFEVLYPYIKAVFDPTLTNDWYKNNVEFKDLCTSSTGTTPFYPLFDFSQYDRQGRQMWATYKDIEWDDTEELEGGSNYTFRISSRKSSIAKTDFEYRTQYRGTLPSEVTIDDPTPHVDQFVSTSTNTPDEVQSVVTNSEEILWWRKYGKKLCYFKHVGATTTIYTWTQKVNSNFSHIHLKLPYTVDIRGNKYRSDTGVDEINSYYDISGYINIPVTYDWVSNLLETYKHTSTYINAFEAYKQNQLNYILEGYVKKNFAAAKYVNNIELVVLRDDSMLHPKSMRIGQEINIIHNGTTYSSILTGKEYLSDGKVKLIFGTIRVDLTKMLKLNQ